MYILNWKSLSPFQRESNQAERECVSLEYEFPIRVAPLRRKANRFWLELLSENLLIAPDKMWYPHNIFLSLHEIKYRGYSLKAPRRGVSDDFPQYMFL